MSAATPMSIAHAWELFRAVSIPAQASDAHVNELRTAFYLGATALVAMTAEMSSDRVSTEQAMHLLSALHLESHEFAAQLVAEAAIRRPARH